MNIYPPFIPDAQTTELVQPTEGSLHHPTINAQAAAMGRMAAGDAGRDPHLAQRVAMGIGIVSAIRIQLLKAIARRSCLAFDGRNVEQFRNVRLIGRGVKVCAPGGIFCAV